MIGHRWDEGDGVDVCACGVSRRVGAIGHEYRRGAGGWGLDKPPCARLDRQVRASVDGSTSRPKGSALDVLRRVRDGLVDVMTPERRCIAQQLKIGRVRFDGELWRLTPAGEDVLEMWGST